MKEIVISMSAGLSCGLIFLALGSIFSLKIPVPAPPVFAGVAGIIGLWLAQPVWASISKFMS